MKLTAHMTDAERARLRCRLAEIEIQISQATQWGAHLTVLDEERRGIMQVLAASEPKSRTPK